LIRGCFWLASFSDVRLPWEQEPDQLPIISDDPLFFQTRKLIGQEWFDNYTLFLGKMNIDELQKLAKKLEGVPIMLNVEALLEEAPGAEYALPHIKFAPGQATVHRDGPKNSYDGVLNEAGQQLLQRCRAGAFPVKAEIFGKFDTKRTGTVMYPDGSVDIATFRNYYFLGHVVKIGSLDPTVFQVGGPISTSTILLYEIAEDKKGWIYTKTGSFYLVEDEEGSTAPTPPLPESEVNGPSDP
jgi:hypothetical protein